MYSRFPLFMTLAAVMSLFTLHSAQASQSTYHHKKPVMHSVHATTHRVVHESAQTPDALFQQLSLSDHSVRTKLIEAYNSWHGVRYRWGGETRQGIDCSALMQKAYQQAFHMNLPRTTREQKKLGQRVSPGQLQSGDLIFFSMPHDGRHVGLYMGMHEFMHASSSHGVMISTLTNPYWIRHYDQARHLVG
jgi:lipoprotein Spr